MRALAASKNSVPINQEVALPCSGAVRAVNNPFHPQNVHRVTPNLQLLQTQLALRAKNRTDRQSSSYSNNRMSQMSVIITHKSGADDV